ncbi:AAA family ATPase [Pseudonocardia sp. DSM 110487]|uniref:ATP-binding protein n=1 Tax=Pseudonocardia sp. DSM 110487 TaxID=2865833 RepID=UPI001C6A2FB9|nr:LuxR family transcriptional regulator [Pseudonocardia sp. DSM 110487]QYN37742.1 AAA family ATPase [Pseudonocardia sp. DSM 110487]
MTERGPGRRHLTLAAELDVRSGTLVGRSVERARIAELVRRAHAGRGGALLVRGEPGIGKSALVFDATERAQGCLVVAVRGVESEVELACSGLGELIGAFVDAVELLPAAQAATLRAVLGFADQPPVTGIYSICTALHSLITLVAEEQPLLIAVDDAHWLDPTSRDAFAFVARRLAEHPALFLMTVRTHEPGVEECFAALPVMELERLSTAESRVLLMALTSEVGIDPRVAAELTVAADGNPLAVRELVSELSAAQLRGRSPLPEPRAVGRALLGLLSSRIARLDPSTRHALLVAAISVDADLATIERAVIAAGGAPDGLEHGAAAGLVRLDGGYVEFSHPLLRSAIVDAASPTAKAGAFDALAATAAPDVRILYRAAGARAPDETVAAGLHHAADRARRAGGHLTAARTLWRAAELSEPGEQRARRMLEAAADAHVAGRLDLGEAWARAAYTATDSAALRADARAEYARAAMWSGRLGDARAVFADAVPHIEDIDPVRAAAILLDRALLEVMGGRPLDAARAAARAVQLVSIDEMRTHRLPWPVVPDVMILSGEVAAGLDILDHGVLDLMPHEDLLGLPALCHAAQSYTWGERFEQAGELIDRIVEAARAAGAPAALPNVFAHRSELGYWTGSWTLAAADAAESIRLGRELEQAGAEAFALTRLGWIQANRGDPAAPATAATATDLGRPGGVDCIPVYADAIRGRYELGRSDFNAAVHWLDRVAEQVDGTGLGNPLTVPWAADHIEALVRTDRRDEALRRLADLDRQAAGTGLAWPAAVAYRCRALLTAGDAADEHFAEAIRHHDRVDIAFDRARTQLCWGNSLLRRRRRQPRRAREHITEALDTFERLRATPWVEQARAALTIAGTPVLAGDAPRTAGLDDLTAQELQVSLAVVKGLSNPEVAAALFLSRKSVERHLSTVYRKLGLRSRTELVAHVSRADTGTINAPTRQHRHPVRQGRVGNA